MTLLLAASGCSQNELGHLKAQQFGDLKHGEPERRPFDARLDAACGTGALTDAGKAALLRRPYLQRVGEREARLLLGSEEDVSVDIYPAGEVRPASLGAPVKVAVDSAARLPRGQQRVAELEVNAPGRLHCYQVSGDGGAYTEPTGFFTAASRGSRVRFSSFGDLGRGTSDQRAVLEQLMKVESEFVLVNGDVAYNSGTRDEFQNFFFDVYEPMLAKVPFFVALGNHDARTEAGLPLLEAFALPESEGRERFYYGIDWGDVHVSVIDTEAPTSEQAAWLARDLAATDATWKIVMGHKPFYSSGYHGGDGANRDTFEQVLVDGGVDVAMFGHEHNYERTVPIHGITHVISGGGGTGTRSIDATEMSAHANRVAHFVHFEATPEMLTMWAIDATGQVFDTWQKRR